MKNERMLMSALDIIYNNSSKYIKIEEVKELIKYINRLSYMSIDNAILLRAQKPNCEYAASERDWFIFNDRELVPEAKPLVIFERGTADFVYALSDTKGKKYILDWNPTECDNDLFYDYYKSIISNMNSIGIDFIKQGIESKIAGNIKAVDEGMVTELNYKGKEYLIKKTHIIKVSDSLSDREIFATIVHELGHYFCGHCGNINKNDRLKILQHLNKDDELLTHEQEEFEAECVNHIVCSRKRIISDTKEQLWTYLDENKEISKKSIKRILEAAAEIEGMLYGASKPINGYIKIADI